MAYSPAQITQYLQLIGLPETYHPHTPNPLPRNINLLRTLHTYQISTIPYENLSLHYKHPTTLTKTNNHHTTAGAYMSIDPEHLFNKLVTRRHGRGGYCFQVVTFFAHILRGMGFKHVYTAQARIRLRDPISGVPGGNYVGFRHAVNIITLPDGTRWSVDVSFGGDGPISPLPLVEGHITQNIGSQQLRLIRDHIPEQHDKTNAEKLWIYQYRNGTDKSWNSYYAFPEIEYMAADLGIANWYTSQFPESFQTKQVIVVLFLRRKVEQVESEEDDSQGVYGKIMLAGNVVKSNTGGRTEVLAVCKSEVDRVRALKEHFGIHLEQEEIDGIVGGITEVRAAIAE